MVSRGCCHDVESRGLRLPGDSTERHCVKRHENTRMPGLLSDNDTKNDRQKEVAVELGQRSSSSTDPRDELPPLIYTTEAKLLRKIDLRLLPCVSGLVLLCYLDRSNVANAMVYGLKEDLNISGVQVSTALTMFFITYILFEIPWNITLKRLTPRVWLSICMLGFGLTTMCTGFAQNYGGFVATRLVLGIAEAGIFPGCAYLMGSWYRRREAQRRFSLYLSATCLATAFGGLIAAAIGNMDGICSLSGWRWIFIIEGILTVLLALVCFAFLPNFPEQAKWLTDEEREYVRARLRAEQGSSALNHRITVRDVWEVIKDPKVIITGILHLSVSVPGTMGTYFAPTIIESLGIYSRIETQWHTVPVWMVAFVLTLVVAYGSDKIGNRYALTIVCAVISIVGYAILFETDNVQVRYAALFLAIAGVHALMPLEVCWNAMNLGGHHRRAVGSAWQVSVGSLGGIIGTYAFRDEDAPEYRFSYALCIGFTCSSAALCTVYLGWCWWLNRQRASQGWGRDMSEEEKERLGDRSPSYRLML